MGNSIKTFVIVLARTFPKGHSRYGDTTNFRCSFIKGIGCKSCAYHGSCFRSDSYCKSVCEVGKSEYSKIHTIRGNYELWESRFKEIEEGKACLSIREWTGTPYRSEQREIARLTKDDGIGLQKMIFDGRFAHIDYKPIGIGNIANNDGLALNDWKEWFKDCDTSKPLAVIYFTGFRYRHR